MTRPAPTGTATTAPKTMFELIVYAVLLLEVVVEVDVNVLVVVVLV